MLHHLIKAGFNPNVLTLGDVRTGIPLMATLLQCGPWNEMAYNVLANDLHIDFSIRTPYLLVNILHVATAPSLKALQCVEQGIPLAAAGTAAAGHTLLHITSQCNFAFPAQMELLGYLLPSRKRYQGH
ncbi:hypothetical protein N7494_007085 [Penicillium frequentans]|uniref:Uncharacterized protein n=1 Tax=Penicillium frequentans TaxID=3151616 RepID=A0AAD6CUN4_9EURO|nr:hypothetical protein N7494_007085 [Penicillium glabrum]